MMRSARVGLVLVGVAIFLWAFHAVQVQLSFGSDRIALLLSPGAHSPLVALALSALFVVSRVVAICLAPALAVVGTAQILLSRIRSSDD